MRFDSIGGLSHHIHALKEMVVFPLLYPEIFEKFKIQPPRLVMLDVYYCYFIKFQLVSNYKSKYYYKYFMYIYLICSSNEN